MYVVYILLTTISKTIVDTQRDTTLFCEQQALRKACSILVNDSVLC